MKSGKKAIINDEWQNPVSLKTLFEFDNKCLYCKNDIHFYQRERKSCGAIYTVQLNKKITRRLGPRK